MFFVVLVDPADRVADLHPIFVIEKQHLVGVGHHRGKEVRHEVRTPLENPDKREPLVMKSLLDDIIQQFGNPLHDLCNKRDI